MAMKKTIAQAKGCVIGKLVKKLRETKKKLDTNDTKPLKLTTRPAKLTEQMNYLKHTANAELATLCLIAAKPAQQVLTNPACDNDAQALALLRSFKTVVERVAQIKAKFGLEETADAAWRTAIREIGKKKQKKTEKAVREKRKAEQKERQVKATESETKRAEWLIENADGGGEVKEDTTVDVENSEELPSKPKKAKVEVKSKQVQIVKEPKPDPAPKVVPPPKRQVDSFFVTQTGSAYMATSEFEERIQPLGPNDGMDRRQRRAQRFGNAKSSHSRPTPRPAAAQPQVTPQRKQLSTLTRPNFAASKPAVAPLTPAGATTDLHPSWLAKQKTKGITTFQGRKMTFSDDADTAKPPSKNPRLPPLLAPSKPTTSGDDSAKLHPSWLAKQKLKPVISEFTGKKTKFGE